MFRVGLRKIRVGRPTGTTYTFHLSLTLGAQKNSLIETVLLSTHNICFGSEIRKSFFCYTLLTKVLGSYSFLYHWTFLVNMFNYSLIQPVNGNIKTKMI